ncbi:MAG: hypothetical protein IBX69_18850 [Anaerolineales bacterium]|nr:hypothetical protein [Anaerolineales bacterium]
MSEDYNDERERAICAVLKAFPGIQYLVASSYAEVLLFLDRVMINEDHSVFEDHPHIREYLFQRYQGSREIKRPPSRALKAFSELLEIISDQRWQSEIVSADEYLDPEGNGGQAQ